MLLIILLLLVLPFILALALIVTRQPNSRAAVRLGHKTFGLQVELERHAERPPGPVEPEG